jgi:hypothetical protein
MAKTIQNALAIAVHPLPWRHVVCRPIQPPADPSYQHYRLGPLHCQPVIPTSVLRTVTGMDPHVLQDRTILYYPHAIQLQLTQSLIYH